MSSDEGDTPLWVRKQSEKFARSLKSNQALPESIDEFTDVKYWNKFADKHADFEWYCTWSDLSPTFTRLIPQSSRILNVGCGNSPLPAHLHSSGFTNVTSVDNAQSAVQQLINKYSHLDGLRFEVEDVTKLSYASESYDCVLDKGLMDAMSSGEETTDVTAMLEEMVRVLAPGGVHCTISLAQDNVLRLWREFYARQSSFDCEEISLPMNDAKQSVFLLVARKSL